MLGDLMSSVSPIEVKVFGTNQKEVQKFAKKLIQLSKKFLELRMFLTD